MKIVFDSIKNDNASMEIECKEGKVLLIIKHTGAIIESSFTEDTLNDLTGALLYMQSKLNNLSNE